jgi:hypothetical protein
MSHNLFIYLGHINFIPRILGKYPKTWAEKKLTELQYNKFEKL